MGYTHEDYYWMTEAECNDAITGYYNKKNREYDHTRMICWYIVAVNRDPKKKMPAPNKFWPLPFDEDFAPADNGRLDRLRQLAENAHKKMISEQHGRRSQNQNRS